MSASSLGIPGNPDMAGEGESVSFEDEASGSRLEGLYERRASLILEFLEDLVEVEVEIIEERLRTGEPDDPEDFRRDIEFYTENIGWFIKISKLFAAAVLEDENITIEMLRQEDQAPPEPKPPFSSAA